MTSELAVQLAIDLAGLALLAYAIFLPRHRRMDLVVPYGFFTSACSSRRR